MWPILENFEVNGVVQITHAQVTDVMYTMEHSILHAIQHNNSNSNNETHNTLPSTFGSWTWRGKIDLESDMGLAMSRNNTVHAGF